MSIAVRIGTRTDRKLTVLRWMKYPALSLRNDKAHAMLRLLYQSMYQYSCSAFRLSWIPPWGAWTSQPAAVCRRSLLAGTGLSIWRGITPNYFSANFHPSLVARTWRPIKCMMKAYVRGITQHQINREKQTVNAAASNSDTDSIIRPVYGV